MTNFLFFWPLLFAVYLLTQPVWGFGVGSIIRYSGFTIDQVIESEKNSNKLKRAPSTLKTNQGEHHLHHCLAIIESSPYEGRKVYYSKKQFIELLRRNPFIASHIKESLLIDTDAFIKDLHEQNDQQRLKSTCVSMNNILEFQVKNLHQTTTEILEGWHNHYTMRKTCSSSSQSHPLSHGDEEELALNFPIHSPDHLNDDKYIIKAYQDPRSEFRKFWRSENFDPEDIRELLDIETYLKLAYKFLNNYNVVTNKLIKFKAKSKKYPEYDIEEELLQHQNGQIDGKEEVDEVIKKLSSDKGVSEEEFRKEFEIEQGLPLATFIKVIRENLTNLNREDKQDKLLADLLLKAKESQQNDQVALEKNHHPLHTTLKQKILIGMELMSARHIFKQISYQIQKYRIKKLRDPNLYFNSISPKKLLTAHVNNIPLLREFAREDAIMDEYFDHLAEKNTAKLAMRKNHLSSQDPQERYDMLQEKILAGNNTDQDLQEFGSLKAQMNFGLKDFEKENRPKTLGRKIYEPIREVFKLYNRYGTDTIVDVGTELYINSTLGMMQPLSKTRAKFFRLTKGLDGGFVMTTNILGLTMAPFTFGLSMVAANAINASAAPFFSILSSVARREPMDSALSRAGARAAHGITEGMIPGLANVNAFFTSTDDLRVAFKAQEYFNKLIRGKNAAVKARWETLGMPMVLYFMRERLNYLTQGLLPRGKFFYAFGNLSPEQRSLLRDILKELQKVKHNLNKSLTVSRLRYDYLLKKGKIPNNMVMDVIVNLDREGKERKFMSHQRFQENFLFTEMRSKFNLNSDPIMEMGTID